MCFGVRGEIFLSIRKTTEVSDVELCVQKSFMEKIKKINEGKNLRMSVQTFGCQMNAHDSEKLIGMLKEMGYSETAEEKDADLIIYNTCCIRENAENKVYGNLGYLKTVKQNKKDLKIILCGCMMQQDTAIEKIRKAYRHVDVIFGTFNLHKLPQLLHTNIETNQMIIDVWEDSEQIVEDLPTERARKFKSSVNIMFGCNNFCSYCIVPYVRGRERSREVQDILKEIKFLADDGVKEIVLLGQNVNSYGKTLPEQTTFAQLIHLIHDIDGIERIRFMTSHPKDLSDELIYAIRDLDKVCNHVHLPFQSGSTEILNRMNRKYTKDEYLQLVEKIKREVKDVAITTDIIVGFPGETEEDFAHTLDVVEQVGFSMAFTYIYSKRTGTPAAIYEQQIEESVVKERFNRLLKVVNPEIYEINKSYVGKTVKVLAEDVNTQDETLLTGRTDTNALVHFKAEPKEIGEIVEVKIQDNKTFYLIGKIIK